MDSEPKRKRVRQSCVACRSNKTRCDGQRPCEPCTVREIAHECHYALTERQKSKRSARTGASTGEEAAAWDTGAQSKHRDPSYGASRRRSVIDPSLYASSGAPTGHSRSSPYGSSRTPSDVHYLSSGSLVSGLRPAHAGLGSSDSYTPADTAALPEEMDRERWNYLLSRLPGKVTCEILLEYVLQECDGIVQLGDVLAVWHRSITRQACSAADAGRMCASLSLAAHLLNTLPFSYYKPPLAPNESLASIHDDMIALSRSFLPADSEISTLDEMEHLLAVQDDLIQSAAFAEAVSTIGMNERGVMHLGLMDENLPQWSGLSNEARERRRRAGAINLRSLRYTNFEVGGDFYARLRINTCRPTSLNVPIDQPIRLDLHRDLDRVQAEAEIDRVHRIKSKAELAATRAYLDLTDDFVGEFSSRVRAQLVAIHEKTMPEAAVMAQGRALIHDLRQRQLLDFELLGFGAPVISPQATLGVAALRNLSQRLWLHLLVLHLEATVLRPWVASRDDQELADLLLQNATETARLPGIFQHLAATKLFAFQVGLLTVPFFNAAITLMGPLLQDAQTRAPNDGPNIPVDQLVRMREAHFPLFRGHRNGLGLRSAPTGPTMLQACAANALTLLDGLQSHGVGPLGHDASSKVSILVDRYHVRERAARRVNGQRRDPPPEPISNDSMAPSASNPSVLAQPLAETTEFSPDWTAELLNDQLFYDLMTQSISYWDMAAANAPRPPGEEFNVGSLADFNGII